MASSVGLCWIVFFFLSFLRSTAQLCFRYCCFISLHLATYSARTISVHLKFLCFIVNSVSEHFSFIFFFLPLLLLYQYLLTSVFGVVCTLPYAICAMERKVRRHTFNNRESYISTIRSCLHTIISILHMWHLKQFSFLHFSFLLQTFGVDIN